MSIKTKILELFKWNTYDATDLESQFNIEKSLNENWDKIDEAVGDLQDKTESNATNIETNTSDIATHQTKITALETDNTKNKSDITKAKSDISTLQADNTSSKAKIATLETDNTNNKSKITSLETDNTANKADIAKLKTDTSKNTTDITKLETDNTTNKENIEANQTAIATQKTKVESLETDNSSNKANISKLQTDVANLETDKVDKEDGKSLMSDTEIERLSGVDNYNDTEIKQDISDIQSEQTTQDESIELLKQENTELKAECERLREDANSLPTMTAEGESITMEGTAEARFKEFIPRGNSKQKTREGYNKIENYSNDVYGHYNCTLENDIFTTTELSGAGNARMAINGIVLKANIDYYVSCDVRLKSGTYAGKISFQALNASKLFNGTNTDVSNLNVTNTFQRHVTKLVMNEDTEVFSVLAQISAQYNTQNNAVLETKNLMISEKNADYEPYGVSPSPDYPSEIKTLKDNVNETICNKNLFDNNRLAECFKYSPSAQAQIHNNIVTITNNLENDAPCMVYGVFGEYQKEIGKILKAGQKYTFSVKTNGKFGEQVGTDTIRAFIRFKLKDGSVIHHHLYIQKEQVCSTTQIIPNDLSEVQWRLDVYKSSKSYDFWDFQIEEDTTATDYIEHKEQSFTIDVQQEMLEDDYLDFESEEEVHTWGMYIFNGTETWTFGATATAITTKRCKCAIEFKNTQSFCEIRSSHFKDNLKGLLYNTDKVGCNIESNYFNMRLPIETITNESGTVDCSIVQQWVKEQYDAETPLKICYKLAEPVRLSFTDEQKAVAKQIRNVKSYKGVTHIFSTDEISPIVQVEAKMDLNTKFKNIETRLNLLETEV